MDKDETLGLTAKQAEELFNSAAGLPVLCTVFARGIPVEFSQKILNLESFVFALGVAGLLRQQPNV